MCIVYEGEMNYDKFIQNLNEWLRTNPVKRLQDFADQQNVIIHSIDLSVTVKTKPNEYLKLDFFEVVQKHTTGILAAIGRKTFVIKNISTPETLEKEAFLVNLMSSNSIRRNRLP